MTTLAGTTDATVGDLEYSSAYLLFLGAVALICLALAIGAWQQSRAERKRLRHALDDPAGHCRVADQPTTPDRRSA